MNSEISTNKNCTCGKKNPAAFAKNFFELFKQRIKTILLEYGYIGIAAAIPALVFLIIYIARGLYPFGNGTVLVLDLNGQYVYFFEALRNYVLEGETLLYSWSRSLGGEFLGIYAYYLASPLSYLVCLFPKDRVQEFLLVMFLIKAAICGGTMGFYLHKHSVTKNRFTILTFSVMYALSAYCVVQQSNTMWIDAVMWLPLVTYGVEQVIKCGKFKIFVIFLALTLASNFYIGYMVCIFVLLYYFFYMLAYTDNGVNNPLGEKSHFLKSFMRMGVFSLIAIGISAVIVLSAYYSLQFGKNEFTDPNFEASLKFDLYDLLFKLLPSSYDTVRIDGLPFVYSGLLTVILAPLFFCTKKFTMREKIANGVMILIFVLSFMVTTLDLVWHGFQKPQWLNARFSFIFCFFMIFLAFRAFESIKKIKGEYLFAISGLILLGVSFLQKFDEEFKEKLVALTYGPKEEDFAVHPYATILLTVVCLAIYVSIIAIAPKVKKKETVSAVLLGVVCVEMLLSGMSNVEDFHQDVSFSSYSSYNEYTTMMRPITDTLTKDYDTSFYRYEKTHHRKTNDNMALNIRGVSNSTSTLNKDSINFLKVLGYYSQSHKSQYKGGTVVSDSLIGMKYIISEKDYSSLYEPVLTGQDYADYLGITLDELKEKTNSDAYSNYVTALDNDKFNSSDFTVYYNPYALSIAFPASDAVLNVNMKEHDINTSEDNKNYEERHNPDGYKSPFTRTNALISGIVGENVELYKPAIQTSVVLDGVTHKVSSNHDRYETTEKPEQSAFKQDKGYGTITYTFTVPDNGEMLYLYLPAYWAYEVDLSSDTMKIFDSTRSDGTINNSKTSAGALAKQNERIIELGFSTEKEYKLTVTIDNNNYRFYTKEDQPILYYADMETISSVFGRIQESQIKLDEEFKNDDISGTLSTSANDQLIMTTIPYDEGWNVYVDGKKVELVEVADALVGFRIDEAGEHNVRFLYRSKYFNAGLVISAVSIVGFLIIVAFEKKIRSFKPVQYLLPVGEEPTSSLANAESAVDTAQIKNKKRKKK